MVFNQKDRQFPSIAMVLIMGFLFWIFVAHIVFMLFMGLQPMTNITSNWQDALLNTNGITMLAVGTVVGGIMAFVAFALTVSSLPMLLGSRDGFHLGHDLFVPIRGSELCPNGLSGALWSRC